MNAHEVMITGAGLIIAVFLSGCMVLGLGMAGITGSQAAFPTSSGDAGSPVDPFAYNRSITLGVPLPASPATVPLYRVVSVEKFSTGTGTALTVKKHIPSVEDAPRLAEKALEKYGGLPADAVLERSEQGFMKKYNLRTGTVEEQYPQNTQVIYCQYVNGSPVMGSEISVSLGENGEILDISKDWITLVYSGECPIISAEEAFEKLKAQELLIPLQCSILGYHISRVQFGYHVETDLHDASARPTVPDTCTPVWIFYGKKQGTDSKPFPLLVNATEV